MKKRTQCSSITTTVLGQCYNIQKRASECKEHHDLLTSFNPINGVISLIFTAG